MTLDLPAPPGRCPACDGGLYVAVRFCPFCGAEQARPQAEAPEPQVAPASVSPPVALHPEPKPPPEPVTRAPSPVPAVAPRPAPSPEPPRPQPSAGRQPPPPPRRAATPRRGRLGLRQIVLAAAAIAGLAALALARRDAAPVRIVAGPAWQAVALQPFRAAPLLRITGDGPFSLRLDGERVLRVAPESGATVRPGTLRRLELRAGREPVRVTLTPRGE